MTLATSDIRYSTRLSICMPILRKPDKCSLWLMWWCIFKECEHRKVMFIYSFIYWAQNKYNYFVYCISIYSFIVYKNKYIHNVYCTITIIQNDFNSSPPSAPYMNQWIRSALVQIMACRRFGTTPLSKPKLGYCQLDPWEQTSVKFW